MAGAADANIEAGIRRQRYATGSRVKYLVDTPEKIWGLLDEGSLLEGTERYLRALEVHKLLMGGTEMERRDLLKTFPLLHHHWPQVCGLLIVQLTIISILFNYCLHIRRH